MPTKNTKQKRNNKMDKKTRKAITLTAVVITVLGITALEFRPDTMIVGIVMLNTASTMLAITITHKIIHMEETQNERKREQQRTEMHMVHQQYQHDRPDD